MAAQPRFSSSAAKMQVSSIDHPPCGAPSPAEEKVGAMKNSSGQAHAVGERAAGLVTCAGWTAATGTGAADSRARRGFLHGVEAEARSRQARRREAVATSRVVAAQRRRWRGQRRRRHRAPSRAVISGRTCAPPFHGTSVDALRLACAELDLPRGIGDHCRMASRTRAIPPSAWRRNRSPTSP